jgi:hypothetical protein
MWWQLASGEKINRSDNDVRRQESAVDFQAPDVSSHRPEESELGRGKRMRMCMS